MARIWFPLTLYHRDKRDIAFAIIIMTLTMTVINGVMIYLDWSSHDYLDDQLDPIVIDLIFAYEPDQVTTGDLHLPTLITDIETRFPHVNSTHLGLAVELASIHNRSYYGALVGVDPGFFTSFSRLYQITEGDPHLSQDEAALPTDIAAYRNLTVGDPFNASIQLYQTFGYDTTAWGELPITFRLAATYNLTLSEPSYYSPWDYPRLICNRTYLQTALDGYTKDDLGWDYRGLVYTTVDHTPINPATAGTIMMQITQNEIPFQQAFLGNVWITENHLVRALANFIGWYQYNQVNFFGLGLPLLAAGWLLTQHILNIKKTYRRQEAGVLKSRGATITQLGRIYTLEGALTGGIAGAIAIPLSLGTATIMASIQRFMIIDLLHPPRYPFSFPIWLIPFSLIFTSALQAWSYNLNAATVTNLTLRDAMRPVSRYTQAPTPRYSILGIILFAFTLGSTLVMPPFLGGYFEYIQFSLFPIALGYLSLIGFFYALTRVLNHYSPRLRSRILQRLHWLMDPTALRLITRRTQRIYRNDVYATVFLSLIIGVGVAGIVATATTDRYLSNISYYNTGSDIHYTYSAHNTTQFFTQVAQFTPYDAVHSTSFMFSLSGDSFYHSYRLYAIDPLSFRDTLHTDNAMKDPVTTLLHTLLPDDPWTRLNDTPNGIILSRDTTSPLYYPAPIQLNDPLNLNLYIYNGTDYSNFRLTFTVVGFTDNFYHDLPHFNYGFVNYPFLQTQVPNNTFSHGDIFIRLHPHRNGTQVAKDLSSLFPPRPTNPYDPDPIQVAQTHLDDMFRSQGSQVIHGTFTLTTLLSLGLCGLGMFLVLILRLRTRHHQIAILRSLGYTAPQLANLLFADTLTLIINSLITGPLIGFIIGILIPRPSLFLIPLPPSFDTWSTAPYQAQFPLLPISLLLITTTLITLTATYLMQRTFLRLDLATQTKIDHD